MASLEELPAEQSAVIQLLLKQGKSYEYIAGMLRLETDAVRARAHAAIDALGPERGRRLPAKRRADVADFLLGQQSSEEAAATREHLAESAGARAWARAIAGELRTVEGANVPTVPGDDGARAATRSGGRRAAAGGATKTRRRAGAAGATKVAAGDEANGSGTTTAARSAADEPPEPGDEGDDEGAAAERAPRRGAGPPLPSSRLGGALLIGGLAILVVVLLVVVLRSGGDDSNDNPSTPSTPTQAAQPKPVAQINMKGAGKAIAITQVLRSGSQLAIASVAQNLPPTTKTSAYAVWLYSSPRSARRLGYTPAVGKNGKLQFVSGLPVDARTYRELVITREPVTGQNQQQPTRPGPIVLRGPLKLS
jgi:hypothetical protein